MQATLLAMNFHASSDSIESQSKFKIFLQRLIVVQQVKISLIRKGHLKMHVPKPVMGLCVCVCVCVYGKNWLLAVQLQEKYDLNPLQQIVRQMSLMYCYCRNILRSRECKKCKQFILLFLLPLLVVVVVAAVVVVVMVLVAVLLVFLVVFVLFKRLKHTLNDSGIETRSILPKQFDIVTVLTLRGGNLPVIEGKIKGGIEVTGRRGRRRRKLLDDLKERRGYSYLEEEALDRTMWRPPFGRGFGPV